MPIIKSAKKRVRIASKATVRNVKTKRNLRSALKDFQTSLGGSKSASNAQKVQSALDIAGKKGVMHKNKVARKQRQLAAAVKAAGIKPFTKKVVPKTATKKAPIKKAAAKKPVAKKSTAKKTTKK